MCEDKENNEIQDEREQIEDGKEDDRIETELVQD
jgi:hypothetical protein